MRPAIERDDAHVVDLLHLNHHVVRRLHDAVDAHVGGEQIREAVVDAAILQRTCPGPRRPGVRTAAAAAARTGACSVSGGTCRLADRRSATCGARSSGPAASSDCRCRSRQAGGLWCRPARPDKARRRTPLRHPARTAVRRAAFESGELHRLKSAAYRQTGAGRSSGVALLFSHTPCEIRAAVGRARRNIGLSSRTRGNGADLSSTGRG